jgi:hypothetical protein
MRQDRMLWVVGAPIMAVLAMQGCSSLSGSGTGQEGRAGEERIKEQAIKEATARTVSPDRSELSAKHEAESGKDLLMDVLFDFVTGIGSECETVEEQRDPPHRARRPWR